jgi:hypothetical protein
VALPPLDLITDLKMLMVHAPGWPTFVAGAALSIAGRTALLAWMLGGLTRERVDLALRFQLVVLPFAFVAAVLLYSSKAVLFYLLFWLGLAAALVVFAVTAAAPWGTEAGLSSRFAGSARAGFRLGTLGAYLLALTLVGALANVWGAIGAVAMVPVSAACTLVAARALREDPGWRSLRRAAAAVPAAAVVALVVVVVTGPAGPPPGRGLTEERPGSVLLMSGVDSSSGNGAILELDPTSLGWTCEGTHYYSYAGPGDGQPRRDARCDIEQGAPYLAADTLRPRDEQVDFLEAQAREMASPGVAAGHSQGVWLLWDAASQGRLADVDTLVLVGAFPENPVSYPAAHERGPGRVGRALLRLVADAPRPGGTTVFEPDSPLGREWLGHPDAIEQTLARSLPGGMRALSVPSAFDLPLMHRSHAIEGAVDACPVAVTHPNLPYADEFHEIVRSFLDGDELPPCPWWRTAVGPALRHFSAPPS